MSNAINTCAGCGITMADVTASLCTSCRRKCHIREVSGLEAEIERLRDMVDSVHPRVWKLVANQREFIVIGEHEPYYMDAYAMIRQHEMSKGTWTEKDRLAYMAACFHKMEMER